MALEASAVARTAEADVGAVRSSVVSLAATYVTAKRAIIEAGFVDEIVWQADASLLPITEQRFLREAAWVILGSGLSNRAVVLRFDVVAAAFLDFESAAAIADHRDECISSASDAFRHRGKITAIADIAEHVALHGFDVVRRRLIEEGEAYLRTLPYLGPATSRHLLKNLGFNTSKPDRHLMRIADDAGREVADLCDQIAMFFGESASVVDLVLWRFATLDRDYVATLRELTVDNAPTSAIDVARLCQKQTVGTRSYTPRATPSRDT